MVVLFDLFHLPDDIYEIVFATPQQIQVAKMLVETMKSKGGVMGKTEMSLFATHLHEGVPDERANANPFRKTNEVISYNKRQFYDRILTPMKSMGMIDFDLYKKVYTLSTRFNRVLMKVGLMWIQEVNKKPGLVEKRP